MPEAAAEIFVTPIFVLIASGGSGKPVAGFERIYDVVVTPVIAAARARDAGRRRRTVS